MRPLDQERTNYANDGNLVGARAEAKDWRSARLATNRDEASVKKILLASALLPLFVGGAAANNATNSSGASALALAALVGSHSPVLKGTERRALADMLDGDLAFSFPAGAPIAVLADAVSCRASNVDISAHSCTLKFGGASLALNGRAAHELYATLVENGVAPEGAAGSVFAAISHLSCKIDPAVVKQKSGGGADCVFAAAP
jgi:uncharacterized Zn-binding protein involved in type VI secretion